MKLKEEINKILLQALTDASIKINHISVSQSSKPEFGDYQFNGIMPLAKVLKRNPRDIALDVIEYIDTTGAILKVEVAGAGFINIWLNPLWLDKMATKMILDDRLDISDNKSNNIVIVDYSGPNMAKEMHVGHLRSTIIGDTLANLLEFMGDIVIRQNHIGDWGTQFGMLIAYLEEIDIDNMNNMDNLKDLEQFYKDSKTRFDKDKEFADRARDNVVKIQSGDDYCLKLWKNFIDISLNHCQEVYSKLDVKLTPKDIKAESFYNDRLPKLIEKLENDKKIEVSNGAKCLFIEGEEIPVIIQKSDGGYLYATTDLSALWYRDEVLKSNRILYVVDERQSEHFKQVFYIAKDTKLVASDTKLEHIVFGTIMDKSGKPFKTRDGGTVKLVDLLDEAIIRAKSSIRNRDELDSNELESLAKIIGIGAVKYFDLSINRTSNYIFNWDKILSLDGNTSLYQQYAYAR
nr:arginine--tRNA ligase [Sulfurovaceae bacterium]